MTDGNSDDPLDESLTDTFFLSFVGECVEVAGSFFHSNEEVAIKVTGYLLDVDEEFYYIGDSPEEITSAIKKDKVIYIQIIEAANQYKQMLFDLNVPEDEEKKN